MQTILNYADSPFLVIWEITRACDLACKHCRASAEPFALPGELTFPQAVTFMDDLKSMGCPILIFSGGDPLKRKDLPRLVSYAHRLGLKTATIPAATDLLKKERIQELKEAGLDQIAFSLDFPNAELHDVFRGSPGAFEKTLDAVSWAKELGLPVQINTVITLASLPYLEEMAALVTNLGVVFWEVFFLVPVGRGERLPALSAQSCEDAFEILYRVHKKSSFILKVTEAPHYRRYVSQMEGTGSMLSPRLTRSEGPGQTMGHAPKAVNSGKGFAFVAYNGEISPSGFLPKVAGNVKTRLFSEIYREDPLFRDLRDDCKLLGRCGRCEFKNICGGSRSRSFAMTGNPFASDPWCAYRPAALD
jgi:AdoMet-dependent heme synthase